MRMTGLCGNGENENESECLNDERRMDTRLPEVERRDAEEAQESRHPGHHLDDVAFIPLISF